MVDENLGSDEADEALLAVEHHFRTQANHSAKATLSHKRKGKEKTTRKFRKILNSADSYGNIVWGVRVQNPFAPLCYTKAP